MAGKAAALAPENLVDGNRGKAEGGKLSPVDARRLLLGGPHRVTDHDVGELSVMLFRNEQIARDFHAVLIGKLTLKTRTPSLTGNTAGVLLVMSVISTGGF